ncbi:hypothetical protein DMH04_31565 [Kibdelosporangium aridum]|uniref:protein-glutamate methylesterase n=1 Tax=Kibdelosporangium aridum TaxID=2030 RepID=A0A428Z2P2_KIBAR|nr:chemotaxis protein CheB [Kibdelosporangium aridum]RSM79550.1 hypothetical protein DMH04_31565 [Kibdelosporangium aridum]
MAPQRHDLIVVGASAGGVEALRSLVATLPPDLRAAVAVVLHLPVGGVSALPHILRRSGKLPTVSAGNGMPVRPGTIYAAPPDHHTLVIEDQFVLSHGPTENGHRPAINALFRSAAVSMGPRVIGVQLAKLTTENHIGSAPALSSLLELENDIANNQRSDVDYQANGLGVSSGFSCLTARAY